jgi:nitrous oxidase accessory protein NosD
MRRILVAVAGLAMLASAAAADTLVVPSDDYPTIGSAVAASMPGDTIVVQPGTYAESLDLVEKSDLRILAKPGAILDPEGNAIDITDCSGIEISGLAIQGANNGIYVYTSTDVRIQRVSLQDVLYEALGLNGCQGVVVSRCTFTTVGGKGIEDDGSTGIVIDRCSFTDCAEGAISLSPFKPNGSASPGARVTRCFFTGEGIGLRAGGSDLVIDRNRFEGVAGIAIDLQTTAGADGSVVSRNVIDVTGTDTAVELFGSAIQFLKNRLSGGGIVEQGINNRIERNSIANAEFGIAVNGSGATLRGNRLADLGGHGLDMTASGHLVEKNRIERCLNSGIYASVTGSEFLSNRVTDAEYGFIVVYSGNTLSKNRVAGTTNLDLWDQAGEGANSYDRNTFRTTLFGSGP